MRRQYPSLFAVLLLVGSRPVQAQSVSPTRPWEQAVSVEQQQRARALFHQAVALHEQLLREQAVAKYQEALSYWENPYIRWNLVLILKDMGQYLHAYENLEQARKWGLEAFPETDRIQILEMKTTLINQHLGFIEAHSDEPDAKIALDGKFWFIGPSIELKVVLPGEHVITSSKVGYIPVTQVITVLAGQRRTTTLFMSEDDTFEKQRRVARRKKARATAGLGIAIGLIGGGILWAINGKPDSNWETGATVGTLTLGGSLTAIGLVLMRLNEPLKPKRNFRLPARPILEFSR